jgi:hypothetical protein
LLNTETLKQLLADPELRAQIPRLLMLKTRTDMSTLEAHAFLSRQLIGLVRTKSGSAAASALREVIKNYLDFCETLINLQLAFNNTLMEKLRTVSGAEMSPPSIVTMNLTAVPDDVVQRPILIKNNQRAAIFVDFETTSFVSEDGTQLVAAEVLFDPHRVELQPQQEAKVEMILRVGEQFKAGLTYLATVTVHGPDAPNLLIKLQVEPARNQTAPSPPVESEIVESTAARDVRAKSSSPKSRRSVAHRAKPSQAKSSQAKSSQAKSSPAKRKAP